jgi:hypothetical protein
MIHWDGINRASSSASLHDIRYGSVKLVYELAKAVTPDDWMSEITTELTTHFIEWTARQELSKSGEIGMASTVPNLCGFNSLFRKVH